MFDIGWSEMLIVGVVALVVIGPKDLPGALRQLGKWMGSVRRMASDFQGQFNEAIREAELDELRREVNNLKSGVSGMADPIRTAGNEVKSLVDTPPVSTSAQPAPATASSEPVSSTAIAPQPAVKVETSKARAKRAAPKPPAADKTSAKKAPRKKVESKT